MNIVNILKVYISISLQYILFEQKTCQETKIEGTAKEDFNKSHSVAVRAIWTSHRRRSAIHVWLLQWEWLSLELLLRRRRRCVILLRGSRSKRRGKILLWRRRREKILLGLRRRRGNILLGRRGSKVLLLRRHRSCKMMPLRKMSRVLLRRHCRRSVLQLGRTWRDTKLLRRRRKSSVLLLWRRNHEILLLRLRLRLLLLCRYRVLLLLLKRGMRDDILCRHAGTQHLGWVGTFFQPRCLLYIATIVAKHIFPNIIQFHLEIAKKEVRKQRRNVKK